jgi:hypothetical protein
MNACQAARNEMRNLAGQPSTRIAAIEGATRNEGAATVATIGLRSRQHTALPLIRACDQFVEPISICNVRSLHSIAVADGATGVIG